MQREKTGAKRNGKGAIKTDIALRSIYSDDTKLIAKKTIGSAKKLLRFGLGDTQCLCHPAWPMDLRPMSVLVPRSVPKTCVDTTGHGFRGRTAVD